MMNPTIKANWLTALRSGKYRKGANTLKRSYVTVEPTYCCLGVLCETIKDTHPPAARLLTPGGSSNHSRASFLNSELLEVIGISDEQQRKLSRYNDRGKPFIWIADYIEKHL
jgi:hypothetical protein